MAALGTGNGLRVREIIGHNGGIAVDNFGERDRHADLFGKGNGEENYSPLA